MQPHDFPVRIRKPLIRTASVMAEGIAALLRNCGLEEPVTVGNGSNAPGETPEVGSMFVGWPALAPQVRKWADSVAG